MITQIHAENFKSWKDTEDLRLAPLTGLFGTNNSGKTSILQTLLLMKQTVESQDRGQVLRTGDDYSRINLGTFSDLVHGHRLDASLRLSFSWVLPKPLTISNPEGQGKELLNIRELSFTTVIRERSNRLVVESFFYKFNNYKAEMFGSELVGYQLILDEYPAKKGQAIVSMSMPRPVKCYRFPNEVMAYGKTMFLPDFALAFEDMFDRMIYLGPLREEPRRIYLWAGERPDDVGVRGEKAIEKILATRVEGAEGVRNEERIRRWLRDMGLIHSFSIQRIAAGRNYYEMRVQTSEAASSEVLITDVGFGVSQILPVLVLCYYVPENSIILLEQPEIHLHPSAQADLADVLIEAVKERNVQIILESHSEHLLRRIQRRIAEEKISQDMVALYFCRMENGESKIEELDVDEFGNIRNWPQNFFGDEMGELVAMTEAAMKRKIESGS